MRYFPFANYHFQMGVTVMGFAEHFGQDWTALCSWEARMDVKTVLKLLVWIFMLS